MTRAHIQPRQVRIAKNRRKSLRLEPAYWAALEQAARERRTTVHGFVNRVLDKHGPARFASNLRVEIMEHFRTRGGVVA